MAKVKANIEEQVSTALGLIPAVPSDYQTVVDSLIEAGVTEATRAITLLKQRKQVKLAVGRNEAGEKYFHISLRGNEESGA